jgi:hypothetical protein
MRRVKRETGETVAASRQQSVVSVTFSVFADGCKLTADSFVRPVLPPQR